MLFACQVEEIPCVPKEWFYDEDMDNLGRADSSVIQCEQPLFFVANNLDDNDEPIIDSIIATKVSFVFDYGQQNAFFHKQTESPYGFFLYTPPDYDSTVVDKFPLLVHLHGLGERGRSDLNHNDLNRARLNGPPMLIQKGRWSVKEPMIVASPQTGSGWNPTTVHEFISFLIDELNIDKSRVYLTGLSMGASGCFNYVSTLGSEAYAAAIVPIAGWGDETKGDQFHNVAAWAFHGDADSIIFATKSISMVKAINDSNPVTKAKLTIYPGVSHDSWTRTFDGTGMITTSSNYDPFDMSIYDWMYQFKLE